MAYGTNAPFGLQPRLDLKAALSNGQISERYRIASGYGTSLFQGDLVTRLSDGTIGICPAGTPALGVFWQVKYVDTFGTQQISPYWQASTTTQGGNYAMCAIIDDPTIEFDVQVSNSLNVANPSIVYNQLGLNANLAIGGGGGNIVPANPTSGNTRSGQSGYYLDFSTIGAGSTESLKIIDFTPVTAGSPNPILNTSGVPFNNVIVLINNHLYKGPGMGVTNDFGTITAIPTGTATYVVLLSDETLAVTPHAGGTTITLPNASAAITNKRYTIKDVAGTAGANNITIGPASGTVDGAPDVVISSNYGSVRVVTDGSAWYTV